jgi:heme/copper-type cytochrome/quinol oxidase subunit 2
MTSHDDQTLRAAWIAMELIGWYLIVPLALAALLSGLVMSLGTPWGLFRHYWVLISFMLTIAAIVVLVQHMPTVSFFAGVAATTDSAHVSELRGALRGELLHAGFGVVLLLAIQMLNVYKPQGMTAYGRQQSQVAVATRSTDGARLKPVRRTASRTPRWVQVVGIHAIGLALLFVVLHLTSGGMGSH